MSVRRYPLSSMPAHCFQDLVKAWTAYRDYNGTYDTVHITYFSNFKSFKTEVKSLRSLRGDFSRLSAAQLSSSEVVTKASTEGLMSLGNWSWDTGPSKSNSS